MEDFICYIYGWMEKYEYVWVIRGRTRNFPLFGGNNLPKIPPYKFCQSSPIFTILFCIYYLCICIASVYSIIKNNISIFAISYTLLTGFLSFSEFTLTSAFIFSIFTILLTLQTDWSEDTENTMTGKRLLFQDWTNPFLIVEQEPWRREQRGHFPQPSQDSRQSEQVGDLQSTVERVTRDTWEDSINILKFLNDK